MNRIRLLHSSRSLLFDKQKFFAAKRLFKAQKDVENTTFKDALKCLSTYSLGQDAVATIHVKVQRDSFKPVRGDVTLPKAPSTTPDAKSTILVFAEGELAEKAKALGAHIVGGEELIADIVQDKLIFHKVLSTRAMVFLI